MRPGCGNAEKDLKKFLASAIIYAIFFFGNAR